MGPYNNNNLNLHVLLIPTLENTVFFPMAPKEWKDLENLVSDLMGPSLTTIVIALTAAIFIPILLHFLIYRSTSSTALPSFLLVGPSGSGKTSLMTLVRLKHLCNNHVEAQLISYVAVVRTRPGWSYAYVSSPTGCRSVFTNLDSCCFFCLPFGQRSLATDP